LRWLKKLHLKPEKLQLWKEEEVPEAVENLEFHEAADNVSEGSLEAADAETPTMEEETPAVDQPEIEELALETPQQDDTDDIDAALAWLESLAVKQGADEETLSVSSEDRLENPPDWVQEEMRSKDEQPTSIPETQTDQLGESSDWYF
jgi:hypothetical protein